MKHKLSRLRIALAATMAALAISLFPTTSYAATSNYWPSGPGYGVGYGCYHSVYFGETLGGIAARYGTSAYYLMQINGIQNPNLIYAGTAMRVPCASPSYGYVSPYSYGSMYRYPGTYMYQPYGTYSYPTQMYPMQPYPQPVYPTPVPMVTPAPTGAVMVVMRNIAFNPATITIHVGQTVMWRNDDGSQHTTTSGSCPNGVCTPMPGWDSGTLNPGQSFSQQFTTTGTFPYFCRIHGAMMQGTIVVMP
ncbi:MAG TPA: LysM peptidoglycan-binding domain-containing protein [Anaerolineae bacterium]|nr:LysM peptidoglycan-binding domain-containing protein [Anaerolineae bacterium]